MASGARTWAKPHPSSSEGIATMEAKTEWTTIRVSKDTKAELEALREIWTAYADKTKVTLGTEEVRSGKEATRDVIGLDQVIRKLIRYHKDHLERVKKSARKLLKKMEEESNQ
jgi:hypothetical protein